MSRAKLRICIVEMNGEGHCSSAKLGSALKEAVIQSKDELALDFLEGNQLLTISDRDFVRLFAQFHAVILRGQDVGKETESLLPIAAYARECQVPFLGIDGGMKVAVLDLAREVAGIRDVHSDIFIEGERTGYHLMSILPHSLLAGVYNTETFFEYHHHAYEFNPCYQGPLLKAGLIMSGVSPEGEYLDAMELAAHPFFIGIISHPENNTRIDSIHPLFTAILRAARTFCERRENS